VQQLTLCRIVDGPQQKETIAPYPNKPGVLLMVRSRGPSDRRATDCSPNRDLPEKEGIRAEPVFCAPANILHEDVANGPTQNHGISGAGTLNRREHPAQKRDETSEAHNAAVERPRDHVSSAPRVHNEMTHMRRARDTV
jgi:hypothetical protein